MDWTFPLNTFQQRPGSRELQKLPKILICLVYQTCFSIPTGWISFITVLIDKSSLNVGSYWNFNYFVPSIKLRICSQRRMSILTFLGFRTHILITTDFISTRLVSFENFMFLQEDCSDFIRFLRQNNVLAKFPRKTITIVLSPYRYNFLFVYTGWNSSIKFAIHIF